MAHPATRPLSPATFSTATWLPAAVPVYPGGALAAPSYEAITSCRQAAGLAAPAISGRRA